MLMSCLTVPWILNYFRLILKQPEEISLLQQPMFWISTGFLFFYGANIFAMGTLNYFLLVDVTTARLLLHGIQLLNVFMNFLFIIALLCRTHHLTY